MGRALTDIGLLPGRNGSFILQRLCRRRKSSGRGVRRLEFFRSLAQTGRGSSVSVQACVSMGKHNGQKDGGGNMERELFFHILGIEETKEEGEIRKAYREKLKGTNPEDNPARSIHIRNG